MSTEEKNILRLILTEELSNIKLADQLVCGIGQVSKKTLSVLNTRKLGFDTHFYDEYTMPFGIHIHKHLEEIPPDYLAWTYNAYIMGKQQGWGGKIDYDSPQGEAINRRAKAILKTLRKYATKLNKVKSPNKLIDLIVYTRSEYIHELSYKTIEPLTSGYEKST